MSGQDSFGVTLAHVNPSLLSCWEAMVKQGEECSLFLKHSDGRITATLQCTTSSASSTSTPPAGEFKKKKKKKKKSKGNKKRRFEALLAFHQRLVDEKGLPPSRLMKQHAAASESASASQNTELRKPFKCDQCNFSSDSKRGLKVHIGKAHRGPEELQGDLCQDNSVSADHSKATTHDKKDIKNDKTRHNCWFEKCSKLSSFKSLSELNSHVRDIHE